MSEYVELENGLQIDPETGEILDCASMDDALAFVVRKRHWAKQQMEAYKADLAVYDAVIKRHQAAGKLSYQNVVCAVRSGTYRTFDRSGFHPWAVELTAVEREAVVDAAKDFDRQMLPDPLRRLYDECVSTKFKRPWVETSEVRQEHRPLKRVEAEE